MGIRILLYFIINYTKPRLVFSVTWYNFVFVHMQVSFKDEVDHLGEDETQQSPEEKDQDLEQDHANMQKVLTVLLQKRLIYQLLEHNSVR